MKFIFFEKVKDTSFEKAVLNLSKLFGWAMFRINEMQQLPHGN